MAKCPICDTEYQPEALSNCKNCGWDLTSYPSSLGGIPEAHRRQEELRLNWARQSYFTHKFETERLNKQLAQALQENTKIAGRLAKANQSIEALNSQLEQLKQEKTHIKQQLAKANQSLEMLNDQILSLERQKTQTEARLKAKEGDIAELTQKIAQLSQELKSATEIKAQPNRGLQLPPLRQTFSFESVTVDSKGKINRRYRGKAEYYQEDWGDPRYGLYTWGHFYDGNR